MADRINSNKKGGKNERGVANALSAWTGFEFARVPKSGGLGWKNRMQVTGDVIPTDPQDMVNFPFSVEAKFYDEIDFKSPLLGNNCEWHEWWIQAASDALDAKKLGILFMRKNFMPKGLHFVVVEYDVFDIMLSAKSFNPRMGYYIFSDELVIFSSRDLFKSTYEEVAREIDRVKWHE